MLQNRHCLFDDVVHVRASDLAFLFGNDFFDPTRIEVDKITNTAPKIREVFNGQAQPARSSRSNHQPGAATRKMLVGDLRRKLFIVGLVVVPPDALFGHAGSPARFEDVKRPPLIFLRHPDFGLQIAKPFILKMREMREDIGKRVYFSSRVPPSLFRPVEPKLRPGLRREMPANDLTSMLIESSLCAADRVCSRGFLCAGCAACATGILRNGSRGTELHIKLVILSCD